MIHPNQQLLLKDGKLPTKHRSRRTAPTKRAVMPAPQPPHNGDLAGQLLKIMQYCQFALNQPAAMQMTTLLAISAVTDSALKGQPSHVG